MKPPQGNAMPNVTIPIWLSAEDLAGVDSLLRYANLLDADEQLLQVERAGEGNMNVTLRAISSRRSLILKQSRSWVAKYPTIVAPLERTHHEARFYEAVANTPAIAERMPRLLAAIPDQFALAIEDLGDAHDASVWYSDSDLARSQIQQVGRLLVEWLAMLHTWGRMLPPRADLTNASLRRLNHAHIFEIPFSDPPAIDLESISPGLAELAAELRRQPAVIANAQRLGALYLRDYAQAPITEKPSINSAFPIISASPDFKLCTGQDVFVDHAGCTLLHGDFFPGSWMVRDSTVHVIDPEFCFQGPAEFDLGVFVAHLRILGIKEPLVSELLDHYWQKAGSFHVDLVHQFAAIEIIRRLVGVAQLPTTASLDTKRDLLQWAAHALA